MGFKSDGNRFKSGDIHIRKGNTLQKPIEVSESSSTKYSYPFGMGAFLMSGCYMFTGLPLNEEENDLEMNDFRRYKRQVDLKPRVEDELKKFCNRFARPIKSIECQVIKY